MPGGSRLKTMRSYIILRKYANHTSAVGVHHDAPTVAGTHGTSLPADGKYQKYLLS